MPLPLFAIAGIERAVMEEGAFKDSADTLLMVCLLLMFWGALRFSDLQHVEVWSMELQGDVVRGYCWKTKASARGMPWGCLCHGIYRSWAPALGCQMLRPQSVTRKSAGMGHAAYAKLRPPHSWTLWVACFFHICKCAISLNSGVVRWHLGRQGEHLLAAFSKSHPIIVGPASGGGDWHAPDLATSSRS